MPHVSNIKLIRTDTTLDLSQKAEKGMLWNGFLDFGLSVTAPLIYTDGPFPPLSSYPLLLLLKGSEFFLSLSGGFAFSSPCRECNARATLESPNGKPLWWTLPLKKINLISCEAIPHVSDIKLIRTDTTLDLSQKAEKELDDVVNEDKAGVKVDDATEGGGCRGTERKVERMRE
ncbi:hypothetical protein Sjap_005332 [Stephania japonica]|uniref:Uncharacterized protein n=1 Tax=Stephania japonica TaxID=461633 RepID=A0AAP0K5F0_9MAGN